MAKFKVSQKADYVTGHTRRAHRDGYEVDDVEYGGNTFEIEEVEE